MTFFDESTMQRIRYLHFKTKHLEDALDKEEEHFSLDEINLILEYTMILNINYQNQKHDRILEELDISPMFNDVEIHDIMFECARALWVMAKAYSRLAEEFEEEEEWENAIVAMTKASKYYKTSAYFSASAVYQNDKD